MNVFHVKILPCILLAGFYLLVCGGCRHSATSEDIYDTLTDLTDSSDTSDAKTQNKTIPDTLTFRSTTEEMRKYMEESEHADQYRRGILPAMVEDVPQYAIKLLMNKHEGFLIVDKATMKLYRYDRYGVLQESMGMACSKTFGTKHARRDNRTPEGFFSIEGKYDSSDWLYTDDDGNTSDVKGQFGPRFMRLKVPNTSQIGIHGTCSPWSIGGRRSHGCIRVTNENILRLFDIVQVGWPVIVSPGRKDFDVNYEEGYDIPTVAVVPGTPRKKYTPGKSALTKEKEGDTTAKDSIDMQTPTNITVDSIKKVQIVEINDTTSH